MEKKSYKPKVQTKPIKSIQPVKTIQTQTKIAQTKIQSKPNTFQSNIHKKDIKLISNQNSQLENQFNNMDLYDEYSIPFDSKNRGHNTNNNQLVDFNSGKVTTIMGKVTNPKNQQDEFFKYQVTTKKTNEDEYKEFLSNEEKQQVAQVFGSMIKQNRMTLGTKIMMENELNHAKEAIESGIYVNWTSEQYSKMSYTPQKTECFRIGSKSMCICGHTFTSHEKIITPKKFSSKCTDCNCPRFQFIPQLPEEVGEYWLPHRKGFDYLDWKGKCKCKHTWAEHNAEKKNKCKLCGCPCFNSAFCCVVCNRFWQDHENVYELEQERKELKKPIRHDYIPLQEMPELQRDLYENIGKMSKYKKIAN